MDRAEQMREAAAAVIEAQIDQCAAERGTSDSEECERCQELYGGALAQIRALPLTPRLSVPQLVEALLPTIREEHRKEYGWVDSDETFYHELAAAVARKALEVL